MFKSSALAVTVAALAVVTAGCGDDDADGASVQSPAVDAGSPSHMSTMDPADAVPGPPLRHAVNAVGDLTNSDCPNGTGPVTATGVVRNTSKTVADYVVRVSWVTSQGAVVAQGVTTARAVQPGGSSTWAARTRLTDDMGYSCTTVVYRGTLASR